MTWDHTKPADADSVGLGAGQIRTDKLELEALVDKEHFFDQSHDAAAGIHRHKPGSAKALFGTYAALPTSGGSYDYSSHFVVNSDFGRLYATTRPDTATGYNASCIFCDTAEGWRKVGVSRVNHLDGYFANGTWSLTNGSATVNWVYPGSGERLDGTYQNNVRIGDIFKSYGTGCTYSYYRVSGVSGTGITLDRPYDGDTTITTGTVYYTNPLGGVLTYGDIIDNVHVEAGKMIDDVDISDHNHDGTEKMGTRLVKATFEALTNGIIPQVKIAGSLVQIATGSYTGNEGTITEDEIGFEPVCVIIVRNHATSYANLWLTGMGTNIKSFDSTTRLACSFAVDESGFSFTSNDTKLNNLNDTYYWIAFGLQTNVEEESESS